MGSCSPANSDVARTKRMPHWLWVSSRFLEKRINRMVPFRVQASLDAETEDGAEQREALAAGS